MCQSTAYQDTLRPARRRSHDARRARCRGSSERRHRRARVHHACRLTAAAALLRRCPVQHGLVRHRGTSLSTHHSVVGTSTFNRRQLPTRPDHTCGVESDVPRFVTNSVLHGDTAAKRGPPLPSAAGDVHERAGAWLLDATSGQPRIVAIAVEPPGACPVRPAIEHMLKTTAREFQPNLPPRLDWQGTWTARHCCQPPSSVLVGSVHRRCRRCGDERVGGRPLDRR